MGVVEVVCVAVAVLTAAAVAYLWRRRAWQRALVAERAGRFADRLADERARLAWQAHADRAAERLLDEVVAAQARQRVVDAAERIVDGALAAPDGHGEG